MATKENPGQFDCYKNAEPSEPMFVLLGRDVVGSNLVAVWCALRIELGLNKPDDPQIQDALKTSKAMREWAVSKGKNPDIPEAWAGFLAKMMVFEKEQGK